MKKRRINYRPLCFVALFLAMGVLVGELIYPFNKFYLFIPAVLSILAGVGLFSFAKTRRYGYMAVCFLVGLVAMFSANAVYDSRYVEGGQTEIQATVDSEITVSDGRTAFYAKDVIYEGRALDGRVYVSIRTDDRPEYRAGDVVVIYGNFEHKEHNWFDSYYAVSVNKSAYYNMWGEYAYKVAEGSPSFPLNFQLSIKQMFYENMDERSAMICQALVLGDKFGIDDNLYDGIKDSGLAHVLAVSGLHVTALASAVLALLKRTKLKPIISFVIVGVLTFFYVMICGFTASAMRAFIMTCVLNFGSVMGFKYDKMSSLCLAGSIILLIRPQSIMDVGFLLSIFSVLGIFMYYTTFKKVFDKGQKKLGLGDRQSSENKMVRFLDKVALCGHNKVGDIVSVSLSANLMTTPLVGYFFKSLPVLFVLSNVIILPYLMFIYVFLLVITLLCQLTTIWGGVAVMQFLLLPLHAWTDFVGGLSWASIDVGVSVFLVIAWIVSAVFSSKYVFFNRRIKFTVVALWLALYGAIITLSLL